MKQESKDIRSEQSQTPKCTAEPNKIARSAKYNYTDMKGETERVYQGFAKRMTELRTAKGISAREMSLSLGQAAGYVNNIENGNNLPSMAMFFEICEYLEVSPQEFFDYSDSKIQRRALLLREFDNLGTEEQDVIVELDRIIRKGKQ